LQSKQKQSRGGDGMHTAQWTCKHKYMYLNKGLHENCPVCPPDFDES